MPFWFYNVILRQERDMNTWVLPNSNVFASSCFSPSFCRTMVQGWAFCSLSLDDIFKNLSINDNTHLLLQHFIQYCPCRLVEILVKSWNLFVPLYDSTMERCSRLTNDRNLTYTQIQLQHSLHYNPRFVYFLPTFWSSFMYCDLIYG